MERRKRRWWTRSITWLSLIVISGALVSGLFQLAVLLAPGYRQDVAARASAALGQPVEVDALALRWRWLWPLLEMRGVRLLETAKGTPVVDVERVRLGFALTELLRGEWIPGQVEIQGVTLAAEITPEGQWRLRGRPQVKQSLSFAEVANQLKRFSRLRAQQLTLHVHDLRTAGADFTMQLQRGDLRLDPQGFELRAELEASQLVASRVRLRAGMAGDLAAPESWQGRWTLDASGVTAGAPLTRLLPTLASVQWTDATVIAAGDWQRNAPGATEISLRAQALGLNNDAASQLRDVEVGLHYRPTDAGGIFDLVPLRLTGRKGAWPTTTARLDWRRLSDTTMEWRGNSDFLRLDDLAPWAAAFQPRHATVLKSLKGDLSTLDARWQRAGEGESESVLRYSLHAKLRDFAATAPGRGGVQGLAGEITADENGGRLQIEKGPLAFELPNVFSGAQRASRVEADVQWKREGAAWRVDLPRFEWSLLGSEGRASGELRLPTEGSPQLKLQARFDIADVAALKPLMPLRWGQPLRDWLDRALVRGRISKAQLDIDGPLADFPYHKNPTGQWSLKLPIAAARLEYHRDWPGIDQLAATLLFKGNGLSFEAQRGLVNGVAVTAAKGGIEDFSQAPLVLDASTAGEAPFYYAFLRASPLATRLQALLTHSEAEGPLQTDMHLEVPLHSDLGQRTIARGEVRLLGNNLRHTALDRPVSEITGKLYFGGAADIAGDNLHGRFFGQPVNARIARNAEGRDELTAAMKVDFDSSEGVAAHYLPRWLLPQLRGSADWRVAIPLAGARSGHVELSSNLVGATTLLPAPFAKAANEPLPLTLDLSGDEKVPLAIVGEIPGRLGLALRFARRDAGGAPEVRGVLLRIGEGSKPEPPKADGWRLIGSFETMEPAAWRALIAALQNSSGSSHGAVETLPFLGASLTAKTLRVAGYDIAKVQLDARREYGGIAATLQGLGTMGNLKLSTAGDALSGQFTRLQIMSAPRLEGTAASPDYAEATDPTRAPTLDFAVDALNIGGRDFGALALATERMPTGQRLRRFTLDGGIARITAGGDWRRAQGFTEAETSFNLTSDDLAGTLEGLGFAATVSGRNARIEGKLTWPAAAGGFDWAQGRGTVSLSVEDGALRTVDPGGTSRVLGLFNFYALPRRLTLDFGDVVSKGLGFDRIEGQFMLANGVAHTDNLTVRGPSVRIDVRGNVGLAAHDYDQVVTVTPNTKGVTLGAMLLGGASAVAAPVLPLIAVIASQVLDKPLGQVTQLTYGLTGSWDNPEIKKLEQPPEPSGEAVSPAIKEPAKP